MCVSVVITCYNQARFLGEAVESVFAQTRPVSEIIVVDDGSSDDPAAVAARYPGVIFIRQDNQGVAAARNTGMRRSTGAYVIFLDGDDRLLPEAVETGLEHLDAHPDCAFVSGHFRAIASDGSPARTRSQPHVEREHYAELLRRVYIQTPATVMFRREALRGAGGFDTSGRFVNCEDHELYLRIARSRPVCCHGRAVAEWRVHAANTSADAAMMLKSALALYRAQRVYVAGNDDYERACRGGVRLLQAHFGKHLLFQIWLHARGRAWARGARESLFLLRHCLPGMLQHTWLRIRAYPEGR